MIREKELQTNSKFTFLVILENYLTVTLEFVITLSFIIIFLIIFLLVLLRYGFRMSLFGGAEFVTVLFIYSTALGSALVFRERKHIKVSFFLELLPPIYKKILLILANIINMIFHILLFYYSLGWIQKTGEFKTAIMKVPYALMELAIPIYAALVVIYVSRIIFHILYAKEPELEEELEDSYEGM